MTVQRPRMRVPNRSPNPGCGFAMACPPRHTDEQGEEVVWALKSNRMADM